MMPPSSPLLSFSSAIDRFNSTIGKTVSWFSLVMALLIFILVILRSILNIGSIAAQELVTYMHAFLFMFAMAFTLKADGHIRVDIFYRNLNKHKQAWVNVLGSCLFLIPFSLFLIYVSLPATLTSWKILEGSGNAGGIPAAFILKSAVPVGGGMLLLQSLAECARALYDLTYVNETCADS